MNTDAFLNDFATRCFRDVADHDYIAARMAYRASLFQQFHWASLQAIEKYLKAILLFNRIEAKDVNHDLEKAMRHARMLPFAIRMSESSEKFIEHVDTFGRFRYLESSFYIYGPKLVQLDKTVWEIRRYCKPIDYESKSPTGDPINMMKVELETISRSETENPRKFKLLGGALENVIAKRDHPGRSALIWQNAFFGSSKRWQRKVIMPIYFHSTNAPLTLHPEILDEVLRYVFLPKEIVNAYRQELARRSRGDAHKAAPLSAFAVP